MRVVRIDRLAPGGADLDMHPRLTVLRGASPELRRRLHATVGALAGADALEETGVIEISGVRLALDAATVGELGIEPGLDPVLVWPGASLGEPHRPRDVAASPGALAGAEPSAEADLRAQLRAVGAERTALGAEMDQARAGLDPHSTASLQVCLGQVEALERRRAALGPGRRRGHGRRRGGSVPVAGSLATRGDAAASLATRLEAAAVRVGELTDRRAAWSGRERSLRAELERALTSTDTGTDSSTGTDGDTGKGDRRSQQPQLDRDAVERLEALRDELHELARPKGAPAGGRNRRRVTELRAEEAILLDRLGYDTYSAYVMGIRAAVVPADREHIERLEARLEALRAEEPGEEGLAEAESELQGLLDEAGELLGTGPVAAQPGAATSEARRVATLLRARRHADREDRDRQEPEGDATSEGDTTATGNDLDAELDTARAQLAEVQARVEAHEQATARVALLRERELELRDRERALLARISAAATPGAATDAADEVGPEQADEAPGEPSPSEQVVPAADPDAAEWAVVARLARQRSVSFVGALPMVVDGVPTDPTARSAVLGRLDRMSDLVQIVVVSDDDAAADWAAGLGERGRCIEF